MSFKLFIGRALSGLTDQLLSRQSLPLLDAVPYDRCWPYDVSRYAGRRDFSTIIDVGANVGQTALYLRRFFPQAAIHSFEPVQSTFRQLQAAVSSRPNIRPHHLALSSASGSVLIREDDYSQTSSVVTAKAANTQEVRAQSLDDFAAEQSLDHIDILKIDVEGHEMSVLQGAAGLLAARKIRCIFVEVGIDLPDLAHTHFSLIHAALEPNGFVFSGLYDVWRGPERFRVAGANALYWNREFAG